MPKETFFNLPEEKRALICRVAIDEFATYPYARASINRIVAGSGIAKGSFYQYFENKQDLFLYLLQLVAEEKLGYLAPLLQNPERHDFFALLRELSRAGIQFALDNPQYAEITKKLLASKGSPIYEQVMGHNLPTGQEFFEAVLQDGIGRGEIRADIDVSMLAQMVTTLYALVVEYHLDHFDPEIDETMMETIDQFLDFLRHGIAEETSATPLEQKACFPAQAIQSKQSEGVSP
jgi:AcrR family transcriptional regulator